FSSRRRHTRFKCDWSSDVCSSDLICAKIGLVSGMGLAGVLRRHYSRWLLYPAVIGLLIANTINAGADIGAVAAAINLLVPIPTRSEERRVGEGCRYRGGAGGETTA